MNNSFTLKERDNEMNGLTLRKWLQSFVGMLCLILIAPGCGDGQKLPDGMPKPQPTSITILQGGSPLPGASIALIPVDSSNQWHAGANTNEKGVAEILTRGQYKGVVPGKYTVVITKRETEESALTAPDPNTDPQGYAKYMQESSQEKLATYDLVDLKFSATASQEQIEIVPGKNEKTIDVGEAVRILKK